MAQTDFDQLPDNMSTEASANRRARAQRVKWLLGYVNLHGMEWPRKMLVARFATEYAVAPATVYAYINQLIDGEYIFLANDHVLSLECYEEILRKDMGVKVQMKVTNME